MILLSENDLQIGLATYDFSYKFSGFYLINLLGMAKMSKTKYHTGQWGGMNAKNIIEKLQWQKKVRCNRRYRCHYAHMDAGLCNRQVRLFFCRRGKREGRKLLITTNVKPDFMQAYEIYSMRWAHRGFLL